MVRNTTRRGKRVLVVDIQYIKADGTQGRYRRDAEVQTAAAARTEDAARRMGATLHKDPTILCGPDGKPFTPILSAEAVKPAPVDEPTLAEVVKRFLAEYGPSALSPSTLYSYSNRLTVWILPLIGKLPVSAAFDLARQREIDVAMINGGISPGSRRVALHALKSVARFAVHEAGILPTEPKYIKAPKVGERVPTAPSEGDVAAVIDAASRPQHRLVILLAAHAGLRKGEILALRCRDCEINPAHPERDRVVVRLSRWKNITKTTKSGHEREVPLTPQLRDALLAAGVDRRPGDECAALNPKGEPWRHRGPYEVFQRALRRLALPKERLHALRAFFITTLLNGGVPVHLVRELAGHDSLATTQLYAATTGAKRGAVVDVLAKVGAPTSAPGGGASRSTPRRPRRLRPRWSSRLRSRLLAAKSRR